MVLTVFDQKEIVGLEGSELLAAKVKTSGGGEGRQEDLK